MPTNLALLVVLLALALIAKNRLIALAASLTLLLRLMGAPAGWFAALESWGVEVGLLFLTMAVLAPIAGDRVAVQNLLRLLLNPVGVAALVGGLTAAWMNARGMEYLSEQPATIVAMVVGSILGASFLRGIPVGPLAAAGITWILVEALQLKP